MRVTAPSLTTRNGTASIRADGAVIAPYDEAPAGRKNVLECISAISADF